MKQKDNNDDENADSDSGESMENQNRWRGPQTQLRSQLEGIMSVGIPNEGILKACQGEHLKEVLGHHPPRVSQGNHLYKFASFFFFSFQKLQLC